MLNLVEQLLGTADIEGHPVWNLRTKTPQNEATNVPWHQGKLSGRSHKSSQVTFIITSVSRTSVTKKKDKHN